MCRTTTGGGKPPRKKRPKPDLDVVGSQPRGPVEAFCINCGFPHARGECLHMEPSVEVLHPEVFLLTPDTI